MKIITIYGLSDPRTKKIRYIGKSSRLVVRMCAHFSKSRRGSIHPLYVWMRELESLGLKPEVRILSQIVRAKWKDEEKKWIRRYRKQLLNIASGGGSDTRIGTIKQFKVHLEESTAKWVKSEATRRCASISQIIREAVALVCRMQTVKLTPKGRE